METLTLPLDFEELAAWVAEEYEAVRAAEDYELRPGEFTAKQFAAESGGRYSERQAYDMLERLAAAGKLGKKQEKIGRTYHNIYWRPQE